MSQQAIRVRKLGVCSYSHVYESMKAFTLERTKETLDELWLLQHESVFTQGQAGREEHILTCTNEIPVVQSDRGGQVTFHGPGQWVLYCLLDLKRLGVNVRHLVSSMEAAVIGLLRSYNIHAFARPDAPGVYVGLDRELPINRTPKIAALGLRVKQGCTFHGLCLNVNMDLKPYEFINPCGYQGMPVTQIVDELAGETMPSMEKVGDELIHLLSDRLGYSTVDITVEHYNSS